MPDKKYPKREKKIVWSEQVFMKSWVVWMIHGVRKTTPWTKDIEFGQKHLPWGSGAWILFEFLYESCSRRLMTSFQVSLSKLKVIELPAGIENKKGIWNRLISWISQFTTNNDSIALYEKKFELKNHLYESNNWAIFLLVSTPALLHG